MSIRTVTALLVALLPALSKIVGVALLPDAVSTTSAGHAPATPEVASLQANCTVTLPLYQPFAFGAVVAAAVMVGAVASRRMLAVVTLALPPALTAAQVAVAPVVSLVMDEGLQPASLLIALSASATVHAMATSPVYQAVGSVNGPASPLRV